jgi:DNA-binding MarR family transcriptional regulator
VTASDFHKAIRKLYEQEPDTQLHLRLGELADKFHTDRHTLLEHLATLETLDLVQFHDDDRETFSLTESGKLANLP